ncbi:MAG: translation initiation factor IF-5A [Candidatus Diapherotrites archaeon]|uniref:Translation initiation factor IF-5A n=1 Tax=Candidatus Iainarchaeum sp. TaxID=3101447 RepID=A0A2D6LPW0_9ARCH|nr:translation initiation factor IF-5A [Candidatus Diapherotrites archaeon]|tara:strand:+ start:6591 stop:6986 length:396 start_codon:yes stop_codon:yes gene_type:complete
MAAGDKKFTNAGGLKPGSYVLIDDEPCQVKSTEKSKPGKHGAAKVRVTAMGVFRDTKKNLLKPTDASVNVPIILKGIAQVVAVMGTQLQIMDIVSFETFDVDKPKDVPGLQGGDEVEYIRWGSNVKVVRKK